MQINFGDERYLVMIFCIALAIVHTAITILTDRGIFTWPPAGDKYFAQAMIDYSICKIITLLVLFGLYYSLYLLISKKGEKREKLLGILKCAAPYLIVIIAVLIIKLPQGFLTNDENSIYQNAITLTHDTWFNYLTVYYYIVSLMILPFKYGPIIMKVIVQLITIGYVVYRMKQYFGRIIGSFSYLLFLLYPIIAYTTSAHRLPIYFLLYLALFTKLLFDKLEGKDIGIIRLIPLMLAGAVLTQWRTEGIYLLVLIPILFFFVYKSLRSRKNVLIVVVLYLVIQYVVSIPQNGFIGSDMKGAANDRMKPFYAYTITNMYRNGLDLNKNAEDLAIVDRYLSLDVIEAINAHYEDINYEDVLILYQEGFVGVREDASVEDFINYSDALKRIFINNPDVFVRTRIGAFCYAALPYHITYSGTSVKELISFGLSIVKSLAYNLFIPLVICVMLCIYSLFRKRWYTFFATGGLIAHWSIVFILAPASYFKYYFPIYIMAYFYVIALLMWLIKRKKDKDITGPVI